MTPEEFRQAGHELIDWIADYRTRMNAGEARVMPDVAPGWVRGQLPAAPPAKGEPFENLLRDLDRIVLPGCFNWQHPRFHGFFPANVTLTSLLGDLVSGGLGQLGLSWQSSPALTEVEEVTTDWLRQMLALSNAWQGTIHDTASTASLVAMLCARERALAKGPHQGGLQAAERPLTVYYSVISHSSIEKAAMLAGFGRDNLRPIPTDAEHRLRVDVLESTIKQDLVAGRVPCALVAATGTTATGSFDPVAPIAEIAMRHGIWLHVDAAMAGSGMICPELRPHWEGVESADSMVLNPHKWLGVAFDCSVYFVRDVQHLVRVMSSNPSYLQTAADGNVKNYRDWGIPLGRRFRALKLWFLIREQGVEGLQCRLRRDLENAQWFAGEVAGATGWRVLNRVELQTVCVRHEPAGLEGEALDRHTQGWANRINQSGRAYLTSAILDGRWMVRVSIGAEATQRRHLQELWALMRDEAEGRRPE
ncbi:MAG TPA: pyridoxal-dependent decarboxylase [Steroidobacteraceae bacterium]|nr:pyridoxal-dependent decarboxylase [Steroidobacteraceae bacterium]